MSWVSIDDIKPLPRTSGPTETNLFVYHDHGFRHEPVSWPVHWARYQDILMRCINQDGHTTLDREWLYSILEDLYCKSHSDVRLRLDYGKPSPTSGKPWKCRRGDKVLVLNPIRIPELDAYLDFIRGDLDEGIPSSSDGCTDIGRDIFSELPP